MKAAVRLFVTFLLEILLKTVLNIEHRGASFAGVISPFHHCEL